MKRVVLFALLLGVAVLLLALTVVWYLDIFQSGNASMTGIMGQMMGNQNSGNSLYAMPGYVWILVVSLIVVGSVSVAGLAYYLVLPQIRQTPSGVLVSGDGGGGTPVTISNPAPPASSSSAPTTPVPSVSPVVAASKLETN